MPQNALVQLADLSPAAKRGLVNFATFLSRVTHPTRGSGYLARDPELWICSNTSHSIADFYGVLQGFLFVAGATLEEASVGARFVVENEKYWLSETSDGPRFLPISAMGTLMPVHNMSTL